jgi:hypothetical protein
LNPYKRIGFALKGWFRIPRNDAGGHTGLIEFGVSEIVRCPSRLVGKDPENSQTPRAAKMQGVFAGPVLNGRAPGGEAAKGTLLRLCSSFRQKFLLP